MSSEIFYSKTPIRPQMPTPAFVHRLKAVADHLLKNGQAKVLKDKRSSMTKKFSKDGITAVYDSYYEDKTITVEGVGVVHYSMNRNESYYDINVGELSNVEHKLGVKPKARNQSRKAA